MNPPSVKKAGVLAPAAVLGLFFMAALFPDLLAPVSPDSLDAPYAMPGAKHLLGTDGIGRDLLSELIYSARISLFVAFFASFLATFLGTLVGMISGYFGGVLDDWLMRMTDVFLLLPALPLIILLAAYWDAGPFGIAVVIGLTVWPSTARVVRVNVSQERGKHFIKSARTFGAGHFYIMGVHILPNILQVVLAKGSLAAASAMVTEAGVSFLGLGDPRFKSWGAMLHDAFTGGGLMNDAYGWYLPPIFCISLTVLCLTLLGQQWIQGEDVNTGMVGARGHDPLKSPKQMRGFLNIKDLSVHFSGSDGTQFCGIAHVDLTVNAGERLAIVGETGSGKSVLLWALMGLLPRNALVSGEIRFNGQNLCALSESGFQAIRGRHMAYVPQGTGRALNPLMRVGVQVAEGARIHRRLSRRSAMESAVRILTRMGIPCAATRSREYPHQYSGGMIQRVLVAMGLVTGAPLVLLDEPTKGLDPDTRDDMLHILKTLEGKTFVVVTHDLAFARGFAHRISVIQGSRLVETAPVAAFFDGPLHPYSDALLRAQPGSGLVVPERFSPETSGPWGCSFQSHCPRAFFKCGRMPPMTDVDGRSVRCWQYGA